LVEGKQPPKSPFGKGDRFFPFKTLSLAEVDEGEIAISQVLTERWLRGYMTEDLTLYESAYWADGFLYHADMGTPADPSDDVILDDIRNEIECTKVVFAKYQDIEIEVSEPGIALIDDATATVVQHYRIKGFVADGAMLESGKTGWYAEGDSEFTFEQRKASDGNIEWRIAQWLDKAVPPGEI